MQYRFSFLESEEYVDNVLNTHESMQGRIDAKRLIEAHNRKKARERKLKKAYMIFAFLFFVLVGIWLYNTAISSAL